MTLTDYNPTAAAFDQERAMIREVASAWARERAPVRALRRLRGAHPSLGYEPALWAEMAEMGWAGMIVPEVYGGYEVGCRGLGVVIEELGRTLTASPLIASALTAASALVNAGAEEQKRKWLPGVADGSLIATVAFDEAPRHAPHSIALTATKTGTGWRLDGPKRPVPEGLAAGLAIVAARTAGGMGDTAGITLFLVPIDAPRLERRALDQIDSRGAALYVFDGVELGPDALLGTVGEGAAVLERTLDTGRAGLAAEMLGMAGQAFDTTLDYLKTRVQFGRVIGSFQALQHRMARLYGEIELTRSAVEAALAAIDSADPEAPKLVSLAKALAGDTAKSAANEMIQMHGGIGMTEEHDAGLYLKRARAAETQWGNSAFHRERWGRLSGF